MTFYLWTIFFLVGIGFFGFQIGKRTLPLLKARRDDGRNYRINTFLNRKIITFIYAFAQKKFFRDDQPAGIMHIVIFWGFMVLSLQVMTMFGRGWSPEFRIPGLGMEQLGGPYGFLKDIFELAVLAGVLIALFRWAITKPQRLYGFLPAEKRLNQQSHWEAYLILLFIASIMISGLFYDAGRMVFLADPDTMLEGQWQPVSYFLSTLFGSSTQAAILASEISFWVHNLVILVFLNLLPRSKHFHIITAIPNVFLGKIEPKGQLPKKDYSGENPLFGRSEAGHFTWKQVLDMYSCTECGRCSSNCPATATGKPLAPRQFLLDLRDSLYSGLQGPVVGEGKPVIDEVVWSCVECRACEEACPVNIEYVDKIVDLRQHLVQEASRFPAELGRAFKGMETQSNPWGISSHERDAWAEGLDVPKFSDKPDAEYLYYVGCGGSFDASNKKATQSFVKILNEAKISFAILGKSELCNGDSARRLGNEYLYQTMAEGLAQVLNGHKSKKILVNCPHCFNTLKNEYPQFGGNYEVTHAAAFVSALVKEGKIKIDKKCDKKVVYHDSCYYGRFNDVYDEPRDLIREIPGTQLDEMDRHHHKGMCCGAGGGRMWVEEPKEQRVNILRTDQALEKKPNVICTSCPFCRIMIGSGVNEKGVSDQVAVMDVVEMVAEHMHTSP